LTIGLHDSLHLCVQALAARKGVPVDCRPRSSPNQSAVWSDRSDSLLHDFRDVAPPHQAHRQDLGQRIGKVLQLS
jgi:hypothetical protein